jgi:hypothetical protein
MPGVTCALIALVTALVTALMAEMTPVASTTLR